MRVLKLGKSRIKVRIEAGREPWTVRYFFSSKVSAKDTRMQAVWSLDMSRTPRTVAGPRQFAVTVQGNTGIDLIFVDANSIAEARDQARLKFGDARVLATRIVRKGNSESVFDPHGVLAREREAQYKRHALPLAERQAVEAQQIVARLIADVANDLRALAGSRRRSRDEVPSDFGGPYHHERLRLEAGRQRL